MKEQKPLGPAQNNNNERNIKICKRNKIETNYKLAREQKPFGPAQIENNQRVRNENATNENANNQRVRNEEQNPFGPALMK